MTSLLGVLDSAALFLALSPKAAPEIPARLCLRAGFSCFSRIARAMGFDIPLEADPEAGITLTYTEFLDAVARLLEVDFPIERKPEEAWPDFVGWRVNYERAAYAIAYALDVVPALWSGPRPHPRPAIPPIRPPEGKPPDGKQTDGKQTDGKPAHARPTEGRQADGRQAHGRPAEGKPTK